MVPFMFEVLLTICCTLAWGGLWLKQCANQKERPSAESAVAYRREHQYLMALIGGCCLASYVLIWLPKLGGFN